MNANDFFTREQYENAVEHIKKQEDFKFITAEHKINGNKYKLTIYGSHYVIDDKAFFVSCWCDYNYKCKNLFSGRSVGGGNCSTFDFTSFDNFKNSINKVLSKFSDYCELETQLCLW